ncbi:MAG: hypothetical protein H7256_04950 [Bdellovibrio sp.]|nr:hypothetical protein [Bdellovibrio sp.]
MNISRRAKLNCVLSIFIFVISYRAFAQVEDQTPFLQKNAEEKSYFIKLSPIDLFGHRNSIGIGKNISDNSSIELERYRSYYRPGGDNQQFEQFTTIALRYNYWNYGVPASRGWYYAAGINYATYQVDETQMFPNGRNTFKDSKLGAEALIGYQWDFSVGTLTNLRLKLGAGISTNSFYEQIYGSPFSQVTSVRMNFGTTNEMSVAFYF